MDAKSDRQIYQHIVHGWERLKRGYSRRDLWIGIIAPSFFVNLLMLAFPLALLQAYDRIIPNNSIQTLIVLIIGVLIVIFIEVVLSVLRDVVSNWSYVRESFLTITQFLDQLFNIKISFYDSTKSGERLEYADVLSHFKDLYGGQQIINLMDLCFVSIFLFLIAYIAGWFVMIPLVMLVFLGIYTFKSSKRLAIFLKARKENDAHRVDFLIDTLSGIHTLKSLAMEALMLRRNERLQYQAADINYEVGLINAQVQALTSLLTQVTIIAIVGFGALLVINGSLTVGGLAACTLLAGRILQPVARSVSLWHRLQSERVSQEALEKIYHLPMESFNEKGVKKAIEGKITFKGVKYQSPETGKVVLDEIDLVINPKETVVFLGENSISKSAIFRLIMNFLDPTEGMVLIDDVPLNDYHLKSLRRQMAYIPENGVMYRGTVLENISNFQREKEEKAREMIARLGISHIISELPKGLETVVTTIISQDIPQGFKQLISLARALVESPKIVLFDRATSAIDMESEKVINSALRQLKSQFTMLMITDKPSLLGLADHVFTVSEGRLKEGFYG